MIKSPPPLPESTTTEMNTTDQSERRHLEKLSSLELLHVLFADQEKRVLELVLEGCNGEVLRAIEYLVCLRKSTEVKTSRYDFSMNNLLSEKKNSKFLT